MASQSIIIYDFKNIEDKLAEEMMVEIAQYCITSENSKPEELADLQAYKITIEVTKIKAKKTCKRPKLKRE